MNEAYDLYKAQITTVTDKEYFKYKILDSLVWIGIERDPHKRKKIIQHMHKQLSIPCEKDGTGCPTCGRTDSVLIEIGIYQCKYCDSKYENTFNTQTEKSEKVNKYKRLEYFIDVAKQIQKQYSFKVSEADMEILCQFFKEVESAWKEIYHSKTFISYPYLFRKYLELSASYDNILRIWHLKNTEESIKKNDKRFKKICEHLNYEFIPTGSIL